MDIEKAITDGIVFKGGKSSGRKNEEKVKTKAKKKSYITGLQVREITSDIMSYFADFLVAFL